MPENNWLYLYDGKLTGIGIDLVAEQEVLALSETGQKCSLVARGRLPLKHVTNQAWRFPPTKLLSWLPSQDYYALNKRFFSQLGRLHLKLNQYRGVIAWSKTALKAFEIAERQDIPRFLNVGNYHCDFEAGGKSPCTHWPRIDKSRLRDEYNLASKILVASDYAAHTFTTCGIPSEKIAVIYRGANIDQFRPQHSKSNDSPFIVASCGLLGERKGTYELLNAWSKASLPNAELWLIGHIPAEQAATMQSRASSSVRFLGFRRDIADLLAQVNAHVLLSRNEGFAKVLLESAACGAVNICTVETGWPANAPGALIVRDRENIDEIVGHLIRLHQDRQLSNQLSEAGRSWVLQNASWPHFRERFCNAIKFNPSSVS